MANRAITQNPAPNQYQRRIRRAEELRSKYSFAAEILRFYIAIARFQESLFGEIANSTAPGSDAFDGPLPPEIARRFEQFLSVVEQNGPAPLRDLSQELRQHGHDSHFQLLTVFWNTSDHGSLPPGPGDFFARAFLQPFAERIRAQFNLNWTGPVPFLCPFCKRKPGLGILRPLGDGGQRSLICSFCLAEWVFRRIVCPGCGEEDYAKLPVYTAEELQHVRVEACDSCKTYIKTVDMTKAGLADPVVDEMASVPLDLWAEQHGYTKLQSNLLQL